MTAFKDITGQKFERLLVVRKAENVKYGGTRWLCKCDCGNETIVSGTHLKSGHTKSCGCLQKESMSARRLDDITGQRFGRWVVIRRNGSTPTKQARWLCRCDCGIERTINGGNLRNGSSKSCGCLQREAPSARLNDLTGRRFSRFVVLGKVESDKSGNTMWKCRCDCGNVVVTRGGDLCGGRTKSCGCLQKDLMHQETGDKNRNWKGGITAKNTKLRNNQEYRDWRLSVYRRDWFRCQKCGKKRGLHAHHILPFLTREEERYDINNGITLCKKCHMAFHDIYGRKSFGHDELDQFMKGENTMEYNMKEVNTCLQRQ